MIGVTTRLFGVLGHPVGHSLSPAMQNAALEEMGLDGVYLAFDVTPERLPAALEGLRVLGAAGVNCTIPLKEAALPLMDELSPEAALIGAVNTVVFADGRLVGHNTDAAGFLADLRAEGFEPRGCRAVVLGAGGAARSVVAGLLKEGAKVTVANRSTGRAQQLADYFARDREGDALRVTNLQSELDAATLQEADLLVNATSVGMAPAASSMPPVSRAFLGPHLFVYDLVYNPLETALVREARARGARAVGGAGMLAHQGALALELWTGVRAPVDRMKRTVQLTLEMQAEAAVGVRER